MHTMRALSVRVRRRAYGVDDVLHRGRQRGPTCGAVRAWAADGGGVGAPACRGAVGPGIVVRAFDEDMKEG